MSATTSPVGADWVGGGELRALRRITRSPVEDDPPTCPIAPPRRGSAQHQISAIEAAIEANVADVARSWPIVEAARKSALAGEQRARSLAVTLGRKLLALQTAYGAWQNCKSLKSLRGQKTFVKWASDRLGQKPAAIRNYLAYARRAERLEKENGDEGRCRRNLLTLAEVKSGFLGLAAAEQIKFDRWRATLPKTGEAQTAVDRGEKNDLIGQFLDAVCERAPGARVDASSLYARYEEWCVAGNARAATQTTFGRELTRRQIMPSKDGIMYRTGLRWSGDDDRERKAM